MTVTMPNMTWRKCNKTIAFAIRFAEFGADFGIPAPELGQMVQAAVLSCSAYSNDNNRSYQTYATRVEEIAKAYDCEVIWNGLWPTIQKTGDPNSSRLLPSYD